MDQTVKSDVETSSRITETTHALEESDLHRGKIVEYIIRRNPVGISEISRRLVISRRTLYNWFENEKLSISDIIKIGSVIDYDFSKEFPIGVYEYSSSKSEDREAKFLVANSENDAIYYWMGKYIQLLEQYNEILNYKLNKTGIGGINRNFIEMKI